jgi:hypothetical protein
MTRYSSVARGQRTLPRLRDERPVADLEVHAARPQPLRDQPVGYPRRLRQQVQAQRVDPEDIVAVRVFMADRLRRAIGDHLALVLRHAQSIQMQPMRPQLIK